MAAELPEPPDGWTVSTATATHIALYDERDGRSLVIRPTEPPKGDTWTVKGLAGYDPEYPVFADGVDREEAISQAWSAMDTLADGDTPSPIRTESNADFGTDDASDGSDETDSDTDDEDSAVDQADLTTFASDGE